jgi:hypothetical protein
MVGRVAAFSASVAAGAIVLSASVVLAQADLRAIAHVDSASVRFPSMMLSARVAGTAHAVATIDSRGVLLRESLRVEATHDLFASAAKYAMTRFAYEPARRSGRPIAEQIDVQFEFRVPSSPVVPTLPVWHVEQDTAGYRIVTGWDAVTREVPAPVLSEGEMTAARQAILEAVRRADRSPANGPLSSEFRKLEAWTPNVVGAEVRTRDYPAPPNSFGGGGRNLWCQAVRADRASRWTARCDILSAWVS